MPSPELENLVRTGQLEREPAAAPELRGLVTSGEARLADARNPSLSLESRFDLAYTAAHALSLAALRLRGYRPRGRFLVNLAEYEGAVEVDERLIADLIAAATTVREALRGAAGGAL